MLVPEAYGCISLAFRHLESRYNSPRNQGWCWKGGRRRATDSKHTEKAQKLFSEANRHLKTRNQPTLGEYDEKKILALMGKMERLGRESRVYEVFLQKIS